MVHMLERFGAARQCKAGMAIADPIRVCGRLNFHSNRGNDMLASVADVLLMGVPSDAGTLTCNFDCVVRIPRFDWFVWVVSGLPPMLDTARVIVLVVVVVAGSEKAPTYILADRNSMMRELMLHRAEA